MARAVRGARKMLALVASASLLALAVGVLGVLLFRQATSKQDEALGRYAHNLLTVEDLVASDERQARKTRAYILTGNERHLEDRRRALELGKRNIAPSSEGEGTTFTVVVPRLAPARLEGAPRTVPVVQGS